MPTETPCFPVGDSLMIIAWGSLRGLQDTSRMAGGSGPTPYATALGVSQVPSAVVATDQF